MANLIASFLYPWSQSKTIEDIIMQLAMFPESNSPRRIFIFACSVLWCLVMILKGFFFPFFGNPLLEEILCYSKHSLGSMGQLSFVVSGCAFIEILSVRLYIFHEFSTSPDHRPNFLRLLDSSYIKEDKTVINLIKLSNLMIVFMGNIFCLLLNSLSALGIKTLPGKLFIPFWMFLAVIAPSYAGPDTNTVTSVAIVCFMSIIKVSKEVIDEVSSMTRRKENLNPQFIVDILTNYTRVKKRVAMYTNLSTLLMLISDILIIPIYAIILSAIPMASESVKLLLKVILIVSGTAYCLRGYILTALLSGMSWQSRGLHSKLISLLVRKTIHFQHKLLISYILEDLSCTRNHWAISKFTGQKVTRMDVFYSIFGTLQLIILGSDFKWLIEKKVKYE